MLLIASFPPPGRPACRPRRQAGRVSFRSVGAVATSGRSSGRRFDREHGVTTQAIFFLSQLDDVRRPSYAHATHYEPVPIEAFRALLPRVPEALVRTATFVDAGAGMGRAILLAAEHPFKQVVGIEVCPALVAIARDNVARATGLAVRCRDVRIASGDVRRFRFPPGNLVLFAFNPFDEAVLRTTLQRAVGSRRAGDRVLLLYHVPVHRDAVAEYVGETLADTPDGLVVELTLPS